MKPSEQNTVFLLSMTAVIVMTVIENVLAPSYWIKSLLKVLVFSAAVLFYAVIYKKDLKETVSLRKTVIPKKTVFLMIGVYVFLIASYFVLKDVIDLRSIRESLLEKEGVSEKNFLLVFGYIILVNSFLEETFFRGFLFGQLKKKNRLSAYLLSSILFSLYHIGIVSSWFSPWIFLLCILGLFLAGAFLDFLAERGGSVLSSWIVHAAGNLAINTIASLMILML